MYQGAHKPLVSKAVYEQIQQSRSVSTKAAWGTKTFAFKDIFKCGTCGASITAEEKFKSRVDGGLNRHVYYHCTKKVDPNCPEKFINENDLNAQLISFIAEHSDSIEVSDELARKMVNHAEIVENSLSLRGITYEEVNPLTEYSRYVLTNGNYADQGRLIQGIKSRFVIRNRLLETT